MNILMNAIQALELDELEKGEKGRIRIGTYLEHGWVVIAISDTGVGIAPEDYDKVFEPFFSTKGAAAAAGGLGLGLGLSISRKIVEEKHAGKIEFESELGRGTTFYIKLPFESPIPPTSASTRRLARG
jgi:signal transduction histidine kinase